MGGLEWFYFRNLEELIKHYLRSRQIVREEAKRNRDCALYHTRDLRVMRRVIDETIRLYGTKPALPVIRAIVRKYVPGATDAKVDSVLKSWYHPERKGG